MKWRHPGRVVVAGFALATVFGTVLLMLPIAAESGEATGPVPALFTAVSAVCVTGLVVVDTPTYWSGFDAAMDRKVTLSVREVS